MNHRDFTLWLQGYIDGKVEVRTDAIMKKIACISEINQITQYQYVPPLWSYTVGDDPNYKGSTS
jgi:hypothetical protein